MKRILFVVTLLSAMAFGQGGTTASDLLPAASGQNLGNTSQRWNLYGQNIDTLTFNGRYSAGSYAGSDAGAKIQAALSATPGFPRGAIDASGLFGSQTFSSFTLLPGHEVKLGSTTASVTSVITAREGSHLFGQPGHWNGTSGGTLLRANASLVGPMVYLAATNPGDWLHGTRLHDLNFDGNKASATSATNCIEVHDPLGEASKLANIYIQGCKSAGVYLNGGLQANAVMDTVSSFANGTYGFDFDTVGASTTLISPSGDDNTLGLIHFKGNGTAHLQVLGLKAESKGIGLQPAVIVAESTQSTPARISILGGEAGLSNGGNPTDFIKIVGSFSVCVHIEGVRLDTGGYGNLINDTVNSVTVPLSRFTGGYVPELDYCPGNYGYTVYGTGILTANNVGLSSVNNAGSAINKWAYFDAFNRVILQNTSNDQMQFSSSAFCYFKQGGACVWTVDNTGKATANGGLVAGASGSTVADSRELVQSSHYCGLTTTCAGTANLQSRMVFGTIPLTAGAATLTGLVGASNLILCTCTDQTTASACKAVQATSTSVSFAGSATDTLGYICAIF